MRKFGSFSLKRTSCWSNSCAVRLLDRGRLSAAEKKNTMATTVYSRDKDGKKCYTANNKLKDTQRFRCHCCLLFFWLAWIQSEIDACMHAHYIYTCSARTYTAKFAAFVTKLVPLLRNVQQLPEAIECCTLAFANFSSALHVGYTGYNCTLQ